MGAEVDNRLFKIQTESPIWSIMEGKWRNYKVCNDCIIIAYSVLISI